MASCVVGKPKYIKVTVKSTQNGSYHMYRTIRENVPREKSTRILKD